MATTLIDSVVHWRKKLDKNLDEDTILNVIRKLSKIPITLKILEATHIGKTIRKLSKRDDIVGEKALAVLKKWRDAFANSEESVDRSSKPSNVSKKENIIKQRSSGGKHVSSEKTVHHKEAPNNEHKHENNSFSLNSSPRHHVTTFVNRDHPKDFMKVTNDSPNSSSLYTYEKRETQSKYMDYDPHADVSEGYNPECPELFPGEKSQKTKKSDSVEAHEQKLSHKHKLKSDEQTESLNKSKRFKSENHSNSSYTDKSKKSEEKKEKNTHSSHTHRDSKLKESSKGKSRADSVHTEKHKSSDTNKSKGSENSGTGSKSKSKSKLKLNCSEEFTSSEVRFEDCLGFNDIVTLKKKKTSKSQSSNKKTTATSDNSKRNSITSTSHQEKKVKVPKDISQLSKEKMRSSVPKPSIKLENVDIISTLPEIQPNYQPLPQRSFDFYSPKKKEGITLTNEDAIRFTSSRREKTAVYSGRKSYFTEVPSLFECCTRVLIENIDAIDTIGGVPYYLLKSVLERCTPFQLSNIEHYNPYLLDSTNELWQIHCMRDYKLLSPGENETWRDLYMRAHDERERKLKSVTANISASMSKSNPVRQVKLAFVDSVAKPPRDVARRQAKNGTARPVSHPVKIGPPSKVTPKPTAPAASSAPAATSSGNASLVPKKPKVAPLMAKTLKSMKQCFRR